MALIAISFLIFAVMVIARIPRGRQAVWLGLVLFTFGCSFLGLIGLISRFGNYQLEGFFLNLPLNQPSWAWRLLARLSLYGFLRFRLWNMVGFLVAQIGLALSYSKERATKSDWLIIGAASVIVIFLLWNYDPEHLFMLFKKGALLATDIQARVEWENQLHLMDRLAFISIVAILLYATGAILGVLFRVKIIQKRIQALFIGTGNLILSGFFVALFCMGRGNVLNMRSMATTLLPVDNYPEFDTTFLEAMPLAALLVLLFVLLAIFRFGFLGAWQPITRDLDQQIKLANQVVRIALHSYKNRFLAIKMALEMAELSLRGMEGEPVSRAMTQIQWARDVSSEALDQLDTLHVQAGGLNLNPGYFFWKELWEEAMQRLEPRSRQVLLNINNGDARIWGDREHLTTVLENIIQNALEAMAEVRKEDYHPTLKVEIGREYEWSFIRIGDNGPGIPRVLLRKIFRPFFTTKSTKNNWGMGLAYCYRVIKVHRGFINIQSIMGEGTTVEVVLRNQ